MNISHVKLLLYPGKNECTPHTNFFSIETATLNLTKEHIFCALEILLFEIFFIYIDR